MVGEAELYAGRAARVAVAVSGRADRSHIVGQRLRNTTPTSSSAAQRVYEHCYCSGR